jgi:hypothetical protein
MQAVSQYLTIPIAETLHRRFVHPLTTRIAAEIEESPTIFMAILFSTAGGLLEPFMSTDTYTERYTGRLLAIAPFIATLSLEVIRRALPENPFVRDMGIPRLTLRTVLTEAALNAYGYFGAYLCMGGIKIAARRIFSI